MAKDPAILFYTSDFITQTRFFDMRQTGEFIVLLCRQHQEGHLTMKQLQEVTSDDKVLNQFVLAEDGKYHNLWFHELILKRKAYSDSRRANIQKRYQKSTYEGKSSTYVGSMKKLCKPYVVHMENENENENRNENKKKKYGSYKNVKLTDEQVKKLQERYNSHYEKHIEQFSKGIKMKEYGYKDHYLAILKWFPLEEETRPEWLK